MIHHDHSMRPPLSHRSNKTAPKVKAKMRLPVPSNASDSLHICSNHLLLCHLQEESVVTRNKHTALRRAYNTLPHHRCNRAQCSTGRTYERRTRHGNNMRSTRNTAQASCTAWANHNKHNHHTSKLRSTGSGRVTHPRHWPAPSGCHKRLSTTLQDNLVRLAQERLNSRHNKYLHNTSIRRTINKPVLRARTPIPAP